jgi:hypothetical protein
MAVTQVKSRHLAATLGQHRDVLVVHLKKKKKEKMQTHKKKAEMLTQESKAKQSKAK